MHSKGSVISVKGLDSEIWGMPHKRFPKYRISCFASAVLQLLFSSSTFLASVELFCRDQLLRDTSSSRPFVSFMDLYHVMRRLQENATSTNYRDLLVQAFQRFRRSLKDQFTLGSMHDANEFMLHLLNTLDSELSKYAKVLSPSATNQIIIRSRGETLFSNVKVPGRLFEVITHLSFYCNSCHSISQSHDTTQGLSISLCETSRSLDGMLNAYFKEESVMHTCEKCKASVATLYTSLRQIPSILLLIVKRWQDDVKAYTCINVPRTMSLVDYTSPANNSTSVGIIHCIPGEGTVVFRPFPLEERIRIQKILGTEGQEDSFGEYEAECEFAKDEPPKTAKVLADGNCFFSSLSWWFHNGYPCLQATICSELVNFIRKRSSYFEPLLKDGVTMESHIRKMKIDGTWATQIEIAAAATMFDIVIYTYHKGKWTSFLPMIKYSNRKDKIIYEKEKSAIYLDNRNGTHFEPAIGKVDSSQHLNDDYLLKSVVCHRGSSKNSGHYVTLTYQLPENLWILCDEDKLYQINETSMLEEAEHNGYMFLYEKRCDNAV